MQLQRNGDYKPASHEVLQCVEPGLHLVSLHVNRPLPPAQLPGNFVGLWLGTGGITCSHSSNGSYGLLDGYPKDNSN